MHLNQIKLYNSGQIYDFWECFLKAHIKLYLARPTEMYQEEPDICFSLAFTPKLNRKINILLFKIYIYIYNQGRAGTAGSWQNDSKRGLIEAQGCVEMRECYSLGELKKNEGSARERGRQNTSTTTEKNKCMKWDIHLHKSF